MVAHTNIPVFFENSLKWVTTSECEILLQSWVFTDLRPKCVSRWWHRIVIKMLTKCRRLRKNICFEKIEEGTSRMTLNVNSAHVVSSLRPFKITHTTLPHCGWNHTFFPCSQSLSYCFIRYVLHHQLRLSISLLAGHGLELPVVFPHLIQVSTAKVLSKWHRIIYFSFKCIISCSFNTRS